MQEADSISTETTSDYVAEVSFDQISLSEQVRAGIRDRGYERPTPVQARAIPAALTGRDLIVRSKTGTGKTAAFGIPMIELIPAGARTAQAIVLCPTRELAIQVSEEIKSLAAHKDLRVVAIYGGAPMKQQVDALEDGAEIIVGTPGRVYDHLRRRNLDLSQARMGVLDEADEMLNQGFFEEVTRILEYLPQTRQMMLFSATVPPDIDRLIRRFCRDPETIMVSGDDMTVEGIENIIYYTVDSYPKPRNLLYLLELEHPDNAIVFCNTRDDTSLVAAVLNRNGYDAEVLNGDLPQKERERVMAKIKRGELMFLVATDIAARGIDISDLSHVINYSLPEDPAVYLHRIGRTGRIGKKGVALSLVSGRELVTLTALEKRFTIKFQERKLPTPEEAREKWLARHLTELRGASRNTLYESMLPLAQELRNLPDGERLTAFLLRAFFQRLRMDRAAAQAAAEGRELEPQAAPVESPEPSARPPARERGRRGDRGERGERDGRRRERRTDEPSDRSATSAGTESTAAAQPAPEERGTKLWCNVGAADKLDARATAELLAGLAGVDAAQIREVEQRPTHSYLFVEPGSVEALTGVTGTEREGKKLRIELPRPRR